MNEDGNPEADQRIAAGRDAFVAGGDIHINRPAGNSGTDDDKLAALVLRQAQEKRSLLIGTDTPGDDTANVEYAPLPGRLNEPGGPALGDLRSVLEYYRSLSPRRLVLIGAPGAGKSVLLLELQIRLLEERASGEDGPVPVVVSASAYDTEDDWEEWLAGQISLQFRFRRRKAAALVASGRILPLIDGLDEMDLAGNGAPERAQALVRALNKSMRARERAPVVVTCRPDEYSRLTGAGIERARHAELSPLTGTEAAAYLRKQFRTVTELAAWTPVLDILEQDPGGPVAAELATPWRLTLALATFRGGGDPKQLLPPTGTVGSNYARHVDNLLLDNYVHVAVALHGTGSRPHAERDIRRWLTSLADGLCQRSATDIALHELARPPEKWPARALYAVLMLAPFLIVIAAGLHMRDNAILSASLVAVFALSASGAFFPRTRTPRRVSRRGGLTARLGSGSVNGLVAGLTFGLTYVLDEGLWKPDGLAAGLAYCIGYGLLAGLVAGLTIRFTNGFKIGIAVWAAYVAASGIEAGIEGAYGLEYGAVIRFQGLYALAAWSVSGLMYGLANGLIAGLVAGLTSRLASFTPKARRPWSLIRANAIAGIAGGIAAGLVTGLTYGLITGAANDLADWANTWALNGFPVNGLGLEGIAEKFSQVSDDWFNLGLANQVETGIAFALTAWFAICAQVWGRYHLYVAWNATRGHLPLRLGTFLNWAVRAGLLRESGIMYQFRHRQLRDKLASRFTEHLPNPG